MRSLYCHRGHLRVINQRVCKPCIAFTAKRWALTYPNKIKSFRWKRAGILIEDNRFFNSIDYDIAYQKQQGRCKICHIHQSQLPKAFHVDHDHITMKFRGLLCFNCNKKLGVVETFESQAKIYLGECNAIKKG